MQGCWRKLTTHVFRCSSSPFKLIQYAIGVPPDPLVLPLWTVVPEQSARPDTITHANEIIITFTQDWNRTFLYISSEKPPPSFNLPPQSCFHARRQSGRSACFICGIWEWPHKSFCLTKAGVTLLAQLSCHVASELMRFYSVWASFLRPDHSGQCGLMQLCWAWNLGCCVFLLLQDKKCFQILLWLALEAQTEALVDILLALCCVFSIFRSTEALRQPAFRLDLQQAPSHSSSFFFKFFFYERHCSIMINTGHAVLSPFSSEILRTGKPWN